MTDEQKSKDDNMDEPFDLSFLEEDLSKLPDAPESDSGSFEGAKFGKIEIDPSLPLEAQIEQAKEAARAAGIPEDIVEKLANAIGNRMAASHGLMSTARNFSTSAAFATMMAGSDEFTTALGIMGHEYHGKLAEIYGDGTYIMVPLCVCELTNDPTMQHQHSAITPPGAPADYDEKRKQFVRTTKKFQRDCAALATLVFGIGIGGVQFGGDHDGD
jgi:hypothetical protein